MLFRTSKRTLERQVPFTEKYAVEINAIGNLITIVTIALICFDLGLIMGGAL